MRGLTNLAVGILIGAIAMFVGLKYHIVRAEDGLHWIPKSTATLQSAYVDIREFDLSDWDQHRELGLAIVNADKGHLLGQAPARSVQNAVIDAMEVLQPR